MSPRTLIAAAVIAAATASTSLAQEDPAAELRFNSGVRFLREGMPDKALGEIQEALKKDPANPFYLKALGITYSQLADKCKTGDSGCHNGHLKRAVETAQKALAINPDYVDVRNDLGIAFLRLGKRVEGKAELMKAFADPQCPTPEVTAWNLGQAFFEEKDYKEAANWFQAAVTKNKSLAAGYVGLGDVLLALGQPDTAIIQLETGLKETQGNTMVQLALGDAYLRAGRFQDARAAWEAVVKKDPIGVSGKQATEKLRGFPR